MAMELAAELNLLDPGSTRLYRDPFNDTIPDTSDVDPVLDNIGNQSLSSNSWWRNLNSYADSVPSADKHNGRVDKSQQLLKAPLLRE